MEGGGGQGGHATWYCVCKYYLCSHGELISEIIVQQLGDHLDVAMDNERLLMLTAASL